MSRKGTAVLFIIAVAMLAACYRQESKTPTAATASDFNLPDLNGKVVRLSDYKGKPILMDFWATWCPPCRAAIPEIKKLHESYGSRGLVVLGISMDDGDWDDVKKFADEYGMTYPILKGTADVFETYQIRTIPTAVLLDKEGKIVKRYMGFGGEEELENDIKSVMLQK